MAPLRTDSMDIQRLVLYAIFFSSAFFLWTAWQQEHAPPPTVASKSVPGVPSQPATAPVPAKDVPTAAPAATPAAAPGASPPPASTAAAAGPTVTIKTDLYTVEVDTVGGVISLVELAKHQDATDPTKPYRALQRNAERIFVAQTGLIGDGLPNHQTRYEALPGPRELEAGSDRVVLRLQATAANGGKVVQILTFHRGSYLIDVAYDVTNTSSAPITPEAYFQLMRDSKHAVVQSSMAPASYVGPVVYNEKDNFKKVDFGEIDK